MCLPAGEGDRMFNFESDWTQSKLSGRYSIFRGMGGGMMRYRHSEQDGGGGSGGKDSENQSENNGEDTNSTDNGGDSKQWDKDRQYKNEVKGLNKKVWELQTDYDDLASQHQQAQSRIAELESQSGGNTSKLSAEDLEDYNKATEVIVELNEKMGRMERENSDLKKQTASLQEMLHQTHRQQATQQGEKWLNDMCAELEREGFSKGSRNKVLQEIEQAVTGTKGFGKMPLETRRELMKKQARLSYMTLEREGGGNSDKQNNNSSHVKNSAILDSASGDYGQPAIKEGTLDEVLEQMKAAGGG